MYCSNCGETINHKTAFCPLCGNPLPAIEESRSEDSDIENNSIIRRTVRTDSPDKVVRFQKVSVEGLFRDYVDYWKSLKTEKLVGQRVAFVAIHLCAFIFLVTVIIIRTINTMEMNKGPIPWWEDSQYSAFYDYRNHINEQLQEIVPGAEFDYETGEFSVDYDKNTLLEIEQEKNEEHQANALENTSVGVGGFVSGDIISH